MLHTCIYIYIYIYIYTRTPTNGHIIRHSLVGKLTPTCRHRYEENARAHGFAGRRGGHGFAGPSGGRVVRRGGGDMVLSKAVADGPTLGARVRRHVRPFYVGGLPRIV